MSERDRQRWDPPPFVYAGMELRYPLMVSTSAPSTRARWLGAVVFAACAAPRVAVLLRTAEPPPNYYWEIATSLLASGSYGFGSSATTAIEPLYPFFLAAARWLTGDRFILVMLLQVLLASAGGVVLLQLTRRLTGSLTAALLSAACYAVYPYYVRQSITPHELTLSVVLLIGAASQYVRTENIKQAVGCGVWLGLLVLLRFAFVPIWLAAVALLLMRRRVRQALVVLFVTIVMLTPWLLRTRAIDGSVVPTRAGENLFIASCEFAEDLLPFHDADLMVGYAYRSVDADGLAARLPPEHVERAIDEALMHRALDCIRADPGRAIRLKLRNVFYVFAPVLLPAHARLDEAAAFVEDGRLRLVNIHPRPWFDRASHAIAHTAILIGGVIGLVARRRYVREDAFLLVIAASVAGVYAIFFPTTRLTSPMSVVLMIYAGAGFACARRAVRRTQSGT